MDRLNILISGVGSPGGTSIIKCLKKNGERKVNIVGADMNPFNAGSYLSDKFYSLVPADQPRFINNALDICEKNDIDVFIPLNTISLLKIASNKGDFEKIGTKVLVSDVQAIEIANNKETLFNHLRKHNLPHPKFHIVDSLSELQTTAEKLGYPKKRVCIKPPVSNGGRGLRILAEDVDRAELLLNEKPNHMFSTIDEIIKIFEDKEFPRFLVMEYLPGKEYSCDMLLSNGHSLVTIPRLRESIKEGITFYGIVEDNREIKKLAEEITPSIGLEFNVNMQFKYSEQKEPQLIEINPRMSGTIVMNYGAGINLPYLGVKLALGENVTVNKINFNVRMMRFWDEIFINEKNEPFTK